MTLAEFIDQQTWPIIWYTAQGDPHGTAEAVDDLPCVHMIAIGIDRQMTNGDLNGHVTGLGRWIWDGQGPAREWIGRKITALIAYSDQFEWRDLQSKNTVPR
jgi:hypothetical protein